MEDSRRPRSTPVASRVQVPGCEGGPLGAHRVDGGLVDQVGQVRAREAGGGTGDPIQVHAGARVLPCTWTERMAERSAWLGSGTVTWRSNRPGRSSAGSRASGRLVAGRLVAARTTMPVDWSKPSISASS
ncbi:hypothetical protein HS99_0002285 [Kitasatospora aureofaciens]|uniref:Uncharacterized protein n=1 Tax=Kitasatospora aureofaciens TaxID=1894 RepID=A0A1E7NFT3_KITAU|nr:hypothetical protein HS99_0002285 [Kitasatospora aureofaciens]